jgi:ribosome modulation factor
VQAATKIELPPVMFFTMMVLMGTTGYLVGDNLMSENGNERNADPGERPGVAARQYYESHKAEFHESRPTLRELVAKEHGIPIRPRKQTWMERNEFAAPPSAKEQGRVDGIAGVSIADCPYRVDTPEESEWLIGWSETYKGAKS